MSGTFHFGPLCFVMVSKQFIAWRCDNSIKLENRGSGGPRRYLATGTNNSRPMVGLNKEETK